MWAPHPAEKPIRHDAANRRPAGDDSADTACGQNNSLHGPQCWLRLLGQERANQVGDTHQRGQLGHDAENEEQRVQVAEE